MKHVGTAGLVSSGTGLVVQRATGVRWSVTVGEQVACHGGVSAWALTR